MMQILTIHVEETMKKIIPDKLAAMPQSLLDLVLFMMDRSVYCQNLAVPGKYLECVISMLDEPGEEERFLEMLRRQSPSWSEAVCDSSQVDTTRKILLLNKMKQLDGSMLNILMIDLNKQTGETIRCHIPDSSEGKDPAVSTIIALIMYMRYSDQGLELLESLVDKCILELS
jgi:hypothetical protein